MQTIRLPLIVLMAACSVLSVQAETKKLHAFHPSEICLDTQRQPIEAHGAGIWCDPNTGVYYWYGEAKPVPNSAKHETDVVGIFCYTSSDLYNWKNEGDVLKAKPDGILWLTDGIPNRSRIRVTFRSR
jgi:hypothetical protein